MNDLFQRAWTVDDWADFLQKKPRTIWRYCDDPRYAHLEFPQPDIRDGNNVRWMPDTARAWIETLRERTQQRRACS